MNNKAEILDGLEDAMMPLLVAEGHSEKFIKEIIASVRRRCTGMPVNFSPIFPPDATNDAAVSELATIIEAKAVEYLHELGGFLVSRMIEMEIELYRAKRALERK